MNGAINERLNHHGYLSLKAFPMWSFRTVVDFTASVKLSPKLSRSG